MILTIQLAVVTSIKAVRNKLHYLIEFTLLHRIDGELVFGFYPPGIPFLRKCCLMHGPRVSCRQIGIGAALVSASLSGTASEARQMY